MSSAASRIVLFGLLVASLTANGVLVWRLRRPAPPPPPPPEPSLARELVPYAALGSMTAENNRIPDLEWSEAQFDAYVHGLRASFEGRGFPQDDEARRLRASINERVQKMIQAEQPDPVEEYFQMLREKENVQRTASGLHYRITHEGEGEPPQSTDTIVVSYAARTPDGISPPALSGVRLRVRVTDLLPGLAEGVQLIKPGGKALIYVPANLSFRPSDWPKELPPGVPIGFFVELHEVIRE